ncbi:3-oxosteroid 1-dehydrogenase [Niveomyces insectorum RCEF 264]|uniref:3-oxosteroid 1-dehydrogenase n=1 Tax=Niveomyces insectorum RCEF 264 TaxID=1081102 RepID=A0A167UYF9_9HYPO|nr:3-oxosteroid 1-dehydrogenase [Niveomyces insectorum RCEF 264]
MAFSSPSSLLRKTSVRIALGVVGVAAGASVVSRVKRAGARLKEDPATNAARAVIGPDGVVKTDVLVVGTGGPALTAALRAKSLGLSTLVVEKNAKIGGTSCFSGSGCWIPNSHVHNDKNDSVQKALTYMETIVGDGAGPASSRERKEAFLTEGPRMVRWLESAGYRWTPTPKYPDYFPHQPGAQVGGRSIEALMYDAALLGPWRDMLNINPVRAPLPLYTHELSKIVRARCSWDGLLTAVKIWGVRLYPNRFLGGDPVCLGVSMISRLLYMNVKLGTPIWTSSPMTELTVDEATGRVTGALVEHEGRTVTVQAAHGVILAGGGFARNAEMRQKYQAPPITADWTSACQTDQGDAIRAAQRVGSATALMDSAWWGAAMYEPVSKLGIWCLYDRGLPHSMIVDKAGQRFANESQNYNALGTAIWQRQQDGKETIPSFLIMDSTHRNRYLFAGRFMPGKPIPAKDLASGFVTKADTLPELAAQLGIDAAGLVATQKRFNRFVEQGVDEDFGRGSSVYDFYLGDPSYGDKNRNLGKVEKGPFYAVKIWPGDLGTKGGVLTDERARALRETSPGSGQYKVIPGLYAAGNTSASVMGRTYAGAGATLGPGLTFGYIAATDCARDAGVPETKLKA